MFVKVVENENYPMTEDFKIWIKNHKDEIFKVKSAEICYDGNPGYILYKVPFRINKHFTKEIIN